MLKYVSKIAMDILPSVAATIIGPTSVNHYIVARPASDAPAAAAVSSVNPKKVTAKADSKPAETSSDVSHLPEAGVRAKGISEKAISEKTASRRPPPKRLPPRRSLLKRLPLEKASLEKPAAEKPTEKSADKPAETASIPADPRRHQAGPREKTAARRYRRRPPSCRRQSLPRTSPRRNTAPPVEAAIAPEDRVNATKSPAYAGAPARHKRRPDPYDGGLAHPGSARLVSNPPAAAAAVRPLPPPIMVSTPGNDRFDAAPGSSRNPPYAATAPADDPRRPTPPADIRPAPRSICGPRR